jgi:hypothetical protein
VVVRAVLPEPGKERRARLVAAAAVERPQYNMMEAVGVGQDKMGKPLRLIRRETVVVKD